jgi:hypothetical protein
MFAFCNFVCPSNERTEILVEKESHEIGPAEEMVYTMDSTLGSLVPDRDGFKTVILRNAERLTLYSLNASDNLITRIYHQDGTSKDEVILSRS